MAAPPLPPPTFPYHAHPVFPSPSLPPPPSSMPCLQALLHLQEPAAPPTGWIWYYPGCQPPRGHGLVPVFFLLLRLRSIALEQPRLHLIGHSLRPCLFLPERHQCHCLCSPDNLITCCTCSPQDQDQRNLIYCLSLSANNPCYPRMQSLCRPGRAPSCR